MQLGYQERPRCANPQRDGQGNAKKTATPRSGCSVNQAAKRARDQRVPALDRPACSLARMQARML